MLISSSWQARLSPLAPPWTRQPCRASTVPNPSPTVQYTGHCTGQPLYSTLYRTLTVQYTGHLHHRSEYCSTTVQCHLLWSWVSWLHRGLTARANFGVGCRRHCSPLTSKSKWLANLTRRRGLADASRVNSTLDWSALHCIGICSTEQISWVSPALKFAPRQGTSKQGTSRYVPTASSVTASSTPICISAFALRFTLFTPQENYIGVQYRYQYLFETDINIDSFQNIPTPMDICTWHISLQIYPTGCKLLIWQYILPINEI